ncbi:hypothetical protein GGI1_08441 [Acidithiobacillus sp. GGI-221]|nr:hypothetical protein GGI1_08441 [Acidithiobacillus sp. GGI-221]
MKKAYNYIAKTSGGLTEEGILVANGEDEALSKLRKLGLRGFVEINLGDSLNLLGSRSFDPGGLASYYMGWDYVLKMVWTQPSPCPI